MKPADGTYREWSTVVDDWISDPMTWDEAFEYAIGRAEEANPALTPDMAVAAGVETMRFVDEHLCSCRARLGENVEVRNSQPVATGGGRLAYHFDSYDDVARYCRTQEEMRVEAED